VLVTSKEGVPDYILTDNTAPYLVETPKDIRMKENEMIQHPFGNYVDIDGDDVEMVIDTHGANWIWQSNGMIAVFPF
jgi:hypothetical protein